MAPLPTLPRKDAFAKPEVYQFLEARSVGYTIRLPSNEVLERQIVPLLKRPEGEVPSSPIVGYGDFTYQAKSCNRARRVVAKVEWHRGELLPRKRLLDSEFDKPR